MQAKGTKPAAKPASKAADVDVEAEVEETAATLFRPKTCHHPR
ncbi:hypothetical protein ACLK1Y_21555 [Escherichia coli]